MVKMYVLPLRTWGDLQIQNGYHTAPSLQAGENTLNKLFYIYIYTMPSLHWLVHLNVVDFKCLQLKLKGFLRRSEGNRMDNGSTAILLVS